VKIGVLLDDELGSWYIKYQNRKEKKVCAGLEVQIVLSCRLCTASELVTAAIKVDVSSLDPCLVPLGWTFRPQCA
jgi:hypothetical protein